MNEGKSLTGKEAYLLAICLTAISVAVLMVSVYMPAEKLSICMDA